MKVQNIKALTIETPLLLVGRGKDENGYSKIFGYKDYIFPLATAQIVSVHFNEPWVETYINGVLQTTVVGKTLQRGDKLQFTSRNPNIYVQFLLKCPIAVNKAALDNEY